MGLVKCQRTYIIDTIMEAYISVETGCVFRLSQTKIELILRPCFKCATPKQAPPKAYFIIKQLSNSYVYHALNRQRAALHFSIRPSSALQLSGLKVRSITFMSKNCCRLCHIPMEYPATYAAPRADISVVAARVTSAPVKSASNWAIKSFLATPPSKLKPIPLNKVKPNNLFYLNFKKLALVSF